MKQLMIQQVAAAVVAVIGLTLSPGIAHAGRAVSGDARGLGYAVGYLGSNGADDLTVLGRGTTVSPLSAVAFTESGPGVPTEASGCAAAGRSAGCDAALKVNGDSSPGLSLWSWDHMQIHLAERDDRIVIHGGQVATFTSVDADGGDDTVDIRNEAIEVVHCGAGTDAVMADGYDRISTDCEHVVLAE